MKHNLHELPPTQTYENISDILFAFDRKTFSLCCCGERPPDTDLHTLAA